MGEKIKVKDRKYYFFQIIFQIPRKIMKSILVTSLVPQLHNAFRIQARFMSGHPKVCALIVGAPGSGKGTISNWIVRDFGLKHVSSGDILRQHLQQGTEVGLKAKQFIDKGDLVPDETMVELISSELKNMAGSPWLLG